VKIESRGTNEENQLMSGTYFHPDIIVHISLWISNEFAFKISKIVNNYIINNYLKEYKDKKDKLDQKIKEYESVVADKNNVIVSLENSNKQLTESVTKLNSTFESVKPKIITAPSDDCKYSTFCLIKISRTNPLYYITTVCERDFNKRFTELFDKYKYTDVDHVANSKYLFDTIKIELVKEEMVEINRNEMKLLDNISENDIKIRIREIHESIDY